MPGRAKPIQRGINLGNPHAHVAEHPGLHVENRRVPQPANAGSSPRAILIDHLQRIKYGRGEAQG